MNSKDKLLPKEKLQRIWTVLANETSQVRFMQMIHGVFTLDSLSLMIEHLESLLRYCKSLRSQEENFVYRVYVAKLAFKYKGNIPLMITKGDME
jgi:hypothetical protein